MDKGIRCKLGFHSEAVYLLEGSREGSRYCVRCGVKSIEVKNVYVDGLPRQRVTIAGTKRKTRDLSPEEVKDFLEHYKIRKF